jgi:hypothetical protein
MCDVVIATAQALSAQDLELLSEEDLPGRTGLPLLDLDDLRFQLSQSRRGDRQ